MRAIIFIIIVIIIPVGVSASPRLYFGGGVGLSSINNSSADALNRGSLILSGLSTIHDVDDIFNQGCKRKSYTIPLANIFFGIKLNRYFAIEAGYSKNIKPIKFLFKEKSLEDNEIDIYGFCKQYSDYFDLIGYLPIWEDMDLFLSFGVIRSVSNITYNMDSNFTYNENNHKESIINSLKKSECSIQPRVGLGLSYNLNKIISLRTIIRHKLSSKFQTKINNNLFSKTSSLTFEVVFSL